ncbi:MAG: tetraacyldisaccharide 4'-kinase [Methylococcales bacterium]|nr:tetraacyldisaccharide 4'-kinase [Methylococcales bacterium]
MIKKTLERWVNTIWYDGYYMATWLSPFSYLYIDVVRLRRYLYRMGALKSVRFPVPVVIVGNITVGGTGKTPLVIFLAKALQKEGFKVGIVTRGYRGESDIWPLLVDENTSPKQAGDEAVLIARETNCPVAAAPLRVEAVQLLLDQKKCDVILADDGLQHYALRRDIEIIVIDGIRRFGNNFFLPCGPLREPQERIRDVNFVINNGGETQDDEIPMTMVADFAVNLVTKEKKPLSQFNEQTCHAVAGIGHPQRFFDLLKSHGLKTNNHSFADHHDFKARHIIFKDNLSVLMTEKDAIKCRDIATEQHWSVPIKPELPSSFLNHFLTLLKQKHGQKIT